jgi:hypothetical protein
MRPSSSPSLHLIGFCGERISVLLFETPTWIVPQLPGEPLSTGYQTDS